MMIEEYRCSLKNSTEVNDETLIEKVQELSNMYGRVNRQCNKTVERNPCMYYRQLFGYELCLWNHEIKRDI